VSWNRHGFFVGIISIIIGLWIESSSIFFALLFIIGGGYYIHWTGKKHMEQEANERIKQDEEFDKVMKQKDENARLQKEIDELKK